VSRVPAGPPAVGPARAAVPWWVLPAIVLSGFVGALMARWVDGPTAAPAPAAVTTVASPPPNLQPAVSSPSTLAVPPAPAARVELSGVLMVDGRPAMALVSVAGAPAVLVRQGDRVTATAAVAGIETHAILLRDGDRVSRIEVAASPIRIAVAPLQPAVAAPTVAAPAAGVAPPPAGDAPGSGNAAFRAAIEDKIRSMNR
jgi:hypothetical protein